jgi:hypothetical protein
MTTKTTITEFRAVFTPRKDHKGRKVYAIKRTDNAIPFQTEWCESKYLDNGVREMLSRGYIVEINPEKYAGE